MSDNNARLAQQFTDLCESRILPYMELPLINDNYLLVELEICYDNLGLNFSFDEDELETYFSDTVIKHTHGVYLMPFAGDYTDISYYLKEIREEMNVGFISPNNLSPR